METFALRTAWSDMPSADVPNVGWALYARYSDEWEPHGIPTYGDSTYASLYWFHTWGWCMWDKGRFIDWGLLEEGKFFPVNTEKWKDDVMTRRRCSHCFPGRLWL